MKKFEIEVVSESDIKILNECDSETLTKILHRGVYDYFYRLEHNKKKNAMYKEYTALKKEGKLDSILKQLKK